MAQDIQLKREKNQPNGYLGLTETGDIPAEFRGSLTGGVTDHGALTGLGDDDHPQYLTQTRADAIYVRTDSASFDHSTLKNLDHDDHPQYLNVARGDARYYTKAAADAKYTTKIQTDSYYYPRTTADSTFATKDFVAASYSPIGHTHSDYTTQTQNDARYLAANAPVPYVVVYNTSTNTWPTRNSVTASATKSVLFIGPVSAPVPADLKPGVDFFLKY